MQGFETCNKVQTCIDHVFEGNGIFIQVILFKVPLNDIHISFISHCGTVMPSQFLLQNYCRDLKLATQFRHALNMCIRETEY